MSSARKTLGALLALAVLVIVPVPLAQGKNAPAPPSGPPCWKSLLNEWYGGAITTIYPVHCYRQAINHLPVDVQVYSSARQDIQAAENAAAHHKAAPKSSRPGPIPGQTTTTAGVITTPGTTTTTDSNPPKKKHGLIGILDDITPGNPQSFPLPLLILGALAILLVIAGGAGMIWQRRHPSDGETG